VRQERAKPLLDDIRSKIEAAQSVALPSSALSKAILSVVESCRRLKLSVRGYLAAVLPGFADLQIRRLRELTPAAWVARHS
jgi:hypothetical protein